MMKKKFASGESVPFVQKGNRVIFDRPINLTFDQSIVQTMTFSSDGRMVVDDVRVKGRGQKVTIDQLMNVPLETRRAWTQHRTSLNFEGRSVCERCGIELPRMMPVVQDVCTHGKRLYIGTVPDATPCGGSHGR